MTTLKQWNPLSSQWEVIVVGGPGPGVPVGGTTAQGLTKTSGTDYATAWTNIVANVQGVTGIWTGTQAAYNALTPTSTVLYIIVP